MPAVRVVAHHPVMDRLGANTSARSDTARFLETAAGHVLAGEFDRLHDMLAGWLSAALPPAALAHVVAAEMAATAARVGAHPPATPDACMVVLTELTLADVRADPSLCRPVPVEVTAASFRQWVVLRFLPDIASSDMGVVLWFEWWLAVVVERPGVLRIGHLDVATP